MKIYVKIHDTFVEHVEKRQLRGLLALLGRDDLVEWEDSILK